ncbi:hypothetical protein Tco_0628174 [Tanacetum coccineum]|uniref:Uncharacterized protein n=1 Tax=Tanacetum coccineum TaxID=301880 RepID=A0ABQ4WPJ9_9ASTR
MSSSTVTYTSISSDYEEPSDAGSPGVVVYGYDRLLMHPVDPYVEAALQAPEQASPSPDYVSGPEHPPSPDYVPGPEEPKQAPLSPNYVPEPEYLEYLEDPEEDSTNYPVDKGDDVDDESSDDDDDDDDEEQEASEDDDEEEEHLAPTDSSDVPDIDPVPSAEDTEAFEIDESAPTPIPSLRRHTARMSVRP